MLIPSLRIATAALIAVGFAASLPYDPYGITFDGAGFEWEVAPSRPDNSGLTTLNVPGAARMDFSFNATSAGPCTSVKKQFRVAAGTGEPLHRPVDLTEGDGEKQITFRSGAGDTYNVMLRALVRLPQFAGANVWAAADGPVVHRGAAED